MPEARPEAWMRGPLQDVHPLLAPVLFSFQQVTEDLALHTAGLTVDQVWARPFGLTSLGFHLSHLAGSIDRLTAYLEGRQLSPQQLTALERESHPGADRDQLLEGISASMARAASVVRALDIATLQEWRGIGRKQLPATVIGLLMHIAEHTQRHAGQAVSAANLARALPEPRT